MGLLGSKALTDEQLDALWEKYDGDKDGTLDRQEFRRLLEELKVQDGVTEPLSEHFIETVFEELDPNKDGSIDKKEFKDLFNDFYLHRTERMKQAALANTSAPPQFVPVWPAAGTHKPAETTPPLEMAKLKALWDHYDMNKDGMLSREELYMLLDRVRQHQKMSRPLPRKFVEDSFKYLDTDNSGYVDWHEFENKFNDLWTTKEFWIDLHKKGDVWEETDDVSPGQGPAGQPPLTATGLPFARGPIPNMRLHIHTPKLHPHEIEERLTHIHGLTHYSQNTVFAGALCVPQSVLCPYPFQLKNTHNPQLDRLQCPYCAKQIDNSLVHGYAKRMSSPLSPQIPTGGKIRSTMPVPLYGPNFYQGMWGEGHNWGPIPPSFFSSPYNLHVWSLR